MLIFVVAQSKPPRPPSGSNQNHLIHLTDQKWLHQSQEISMNHRDLVSQLILEVFLMLADPSPEPDDQNMPIEEAGGKDTCGTSSSAMNRNIAAERRLEFRNCAGESVDFDSQDKDSSMESQHSLFGGRREAILSGELAEDSSTTIVADSGEGSGPDSLSSSSFSRQMYINSPSPVESSNG